MLPLFLSPLMKWFDTLGYVLVVRLLMDLFVVTCCNSLLAGVWSVPTWPDNTLLFTQIPIATSGIRAMGYLMRHHLRAEGVGVSQRMITQFVKVEQEPLRSADDGRLFTSLFNEEVSPHKNVIPRLRLSRANRNCYCLGFTSYQQLEGFFYRKCLEGQS